MKIVIAPDSYKGCLTAFEVANAIQKGIKKFDNSINTVIVPMADGGEGTVQSLIDASNGKIVEVTVRDPLFRQISSFYGIMGDGKTAVIEMAAASGLPLLSLSERNPLKTTTFGTGELIKDALDKGCRKIIIGLGGSATNDGGCGMAQALGVRFYDRTNNEIGLGGGELAQLYKIDVSNLDSRVSQCDFLVACDVENPLCGPNGASAIYAPQKGATPQMVSMLDQNLKTFAAIAAQQLNINVEHAKGAGAAGGMGAGVQLFLNAKLERGIDIVTKITNLANKIEYSDLVITGEGTIDYQTAFGKTPFGVAQVAKQFDIPVIAIAGTLGKDYNTLYHNGFDAIYSIVNRPMLLDEAILRAPELIEETTENIMRTIQILNKIGVIKK